MIFNKISERNQLRAESGGPLMSPALESEVEIWIMAGNETKPGARLCGNASEATL